MADEKKSYMVDLSIEVFTEDDEIVKAIQLHSVKNELIPLHHLRRPAAAADERLGRMAPGEKVLVTGENRRPLVEKGKGYVITDYYGSCIPGDIFKGISDYELEHCRSGEIFKVNRNIMDRLFKCCGDFDPRWTLPISPENLELVSKIKKEMEC